MKKKIFAFILGIAAFVSITATGCVVRTGYDHYNERGIHDHDHYDHR